MADARSNLGRSRAIRNRYAGDSGSSRHHFGIDSGSGVDGGSICSPHSGGRSVGSLRGRSVVESGSMWGWGRHGVGPGSTRSRLPGRGRSRVPVDRFRSRLGLGSGLGHWKMCPVGPPPHVVFSGRPVPSRSAARAAPRLRRAAPRPLWPARATAWPRPQRPSPRGLGARLGGCAWGGHPTAPPPGLRARKAAATLCATRKAAAPCPRWAWRAT